MSEKPLHHGRDHRNGGEDPIPGLVPAASAYLQATTSHTFTGSGGIAVPWDHFQTTDTSVFGTQVSVFTTLPPNNSAGDVTLLGLQAGAYIAEATIVWGSPSSNFYGQLQVLAADYLDDQGPQATGDLASTSAPMSLEGDYQTFDVRLLTATATDPGIAIYLFAKGQTATSYTITSCSLVCHWLGGGIGADNSVY